MDRPISLYYSHPSSLAHETGAHPENAGRIRAIEAALGRAGWPGLERCEPPRASREQLARAHAESHLDDLARLCAAGGGQIDPDTVAGPASWEAALHAAGAACDASERLLAGEAQGAVCALRPPGHHAEHDRAMGFCLLNNVAIGAHHALAACAAERVLVIDWDVHHGNGIERIFRDSPAVLYASIHQWPLYPATGPAEYEGEGDGFGYTANMPVAAGAGPDEFLALIQHVVCPIGRAYRPDLIMIAAGFDAHRADPLASCRLDAATYGQMTAAVRGLAGELGVPVLICLEGGYDPDALAASMLACVVALGEQAPAPRLAAAAAAEPHRARLAERWGF